MAKFSTGIFKPKNPQKFIGKHAARWRSSWELTLMNFLDINESVLYWSSEEIRIPYKHPFTNKITTYVPDFFVVSVDKNGKQNAEIIEIKPKSQSIIQEGKKTSQKNAVQVAINHCKWQAALAYCKKNNIGFRVMTEEQIYYQGKKK